MSENRIKLLYVSSDTFPPTRVDVSVLFGKELVSRGHQVDWLLQSEGACDKSYETETEIGKTWVGKTDKGTSLPRRMRKHLFSILHDFRLFGIVRANQYNVVQVKDKFIAALFALVACKLNRVPLVYWLSYPFPEASIYRYHDGSARYPLLYLIRGTITKFLLYKIILPRARHIFVQSEQMKSDIAQHNIAMEKMTAIPMGISMEDFPSAETVFSNLEDKNNFNFLYLGTLLKVRKIDFIVRVLAHVKRIIPQANLLLVGRGDDSSDEKVLRNEAQRLGVIDSIEFTGHLQRNEALQYVSKAAVCVSPFYPTPILNSASPTKLIEYMAMGKAVVANDQPEQKLVIDESGAGICVPYEEHVFANAIVELLKNPSKRQEMGRKGRRYAEEKRDYKTIVKVVERDLQKVISAR